MTEINPEHLATRIAKFRDERRALQEMVVACFPIGCTVRSKATGAVGKVVSTTQHPDLLHVRFRFDNTSASSFSHAAAADVVDLEQVNES